MTLDETLSPIREKLQKAVELELATIPPYLTAMFSIKPETNIPAANLIRSVFMEEMLHMVLAANILSAIGGRLTLARENLPVYPCRLRFEGKDFRDREFDVHLEALSKGSLLTFMQIELPQFAGAMKIERVELIEIPGYTIGEFYQSITTDLKEACERFTEDKVFHGNPSFQVSEQYYWSGAGKPIVVRKLDDAEEAIKVIVEQGEGAAIDPTNPPKDFFSPCKDVPHYFRFKEIYEERHYLRDDNPTDSPHGDPMPVNYAEVYPIKPDCKSEDFAGESELQHLNRLFNSNYTMMLSQIAEGFNGNPAAFYTAIMNGMRNLTPIARQMVKIPILGDQQQRHGAPSFEWAEN